MWPYRPWLFKAQQPLQGPNIKQDEDTCPQQLQEQQQSRPAIRPHLQPQPQPQSGTRIRPQAPVRDWTRRYQPSINSRVYGYPSSGGVLILPGYHIDLPYLGLERFVDAKRVPNLIEEDAFCRRLRYLGALWWPYPDADLDAMKGHGSKEDADKAATHVCVGWLANGGGVWVLKYNENVHDDNELSLKAQRIGSLNMNDRCRMIEQLGGKFYKHPEECADLRWGNWPALQ